MESLDDNIKEKLDKFVKFVKKELNIKHVPTIALLNSRSNIKTTANYDYTKKNKITRIPSRKNRILFRKVFFLFLFNYKRRAEFKTFLFCILFDEFSTAHIFA